MTGSVENFKTNPPPDIGISDATVPGNNSPVEQTGCPDFNFSTVDWINDLIHMRMPEADARQLLLELSPEKVTPDLLARLVAAMTATGVSVPAVDGDVMDCCGTGGSGLPHYNTSTTVAFVLAAGGVKVVKFGNRAASSKSGSFDFLDALGISAECQLDRLPEILDQTGLVFLYAPQCYPALVPLARLRREVKVRTVFNFLGPLLNPIKPAYRLLGISHAGMQQRMAEYLAQSLDTKRAWLVSGMNGTAGLDEIAPHGETSLLEVVGDELQHHVLSYQFKGALTMACDHTPEDNLKIFQALVAGEDHYSICYRMVCLNAGAGLHVAGKADSLEDGIRLAEGLLVGGKVRETVERCRRMSGV